MTSNEGNKHQMVSNVQMLLMTSCEPDATTTCYSIQNVSDNSHGNDDDWIINLKLFETFNTSFAQNVFIFITSIGVL